MVRVRKHIDVNIPRAWESYFQGALKKPGKKSLRSTSFAVVEGVFVLSEKIVKKRVCVSLTKPYLNAMEHLICQGVYVNRAEVVKDALRRLFRHYEVKV